MNVPITVAVGTQFDADSSEDLWLIDVTNTEAIPCKADTDAYYYINITDGTNTVTYAFKVADPGTIAAATVKEFVVLKDGSLGTVTDSSGEIYYTTAA